MWQGASSACMLTTPPAPPPKLWPQFLKGSTLEECYAAVAAVANRWLDMLDTQVRAWRDNAPLARPLPRCRQAQTPPPPPRALT